MRATPSGAFSSLLRRLREAKKLAQREVASRARVSTKHISELELGDALPTHDTVATLSNALGLGHAEECLLFQAAGFRPPNSPPRDGPAWENLVVEISEIVRLSDPNPTVAFSEADWRLVSVNLSFIAMASAIFERSIPTSSQEDDLDVVRAYFFDPIVERNVVNIVDMRRYVLGRMRRDAAIEGPNSRAAKLRDDLCDHYPSLKDEPVDYLEPFHTLHACVDTVDLRWQCALSTLGSIHDVSHKGIMMVTLFPLDPQTREWLVARIRAFV